MPQQSHLSPHSQSAHRVRFDWGPTGAATVADGADLAVVVDVLSFTTTLTVAVGRGIAVLPYRWRDARAATYAEEQAAVLAVGRLEARSAGSSAVSLSPAAMAAVTGVDRVVLPSPNGSSICFGLAETGAQVVGACLRNRAAVAAWLAARLADGATLAVVAAGERWPDDTLRPAVEDLLGAGAVLASLRDLGVGGFSPEADLAALAFEAVADRVADLVRGCASGRELAEADFAADVEAAVTVDADAVVPVLSGRAFAAASPPATPTGPAAGT